ncbi:MAG: hypothetical protein HY744_27340 [Deltaproteobacteria bacterium]|nr:hypothetical protein [Deltaproteobacteria bacterium]
MHARPVAPMASALVAALAVAVAGCNAVPRLHSPESLPASGSSTTKFHMQGGQLCVLEEWGRVGDHIEGTGSLYDVERALLARGRLRVPLNGLAVVQTSGYEFRYGAIPMMIATAGMIGGAVACAVNPKACFGSCPTFYVPAGKSWRLQAEGFSTSVARALEATDLDALSDAVPERGFVTVAMRNEALETHVVRSLGVVSVLGPPGSTVLRTHERDFVAVGPRHAAEACTWEREVCPLVAERDGIELLPESDPADLAARTHLELGFGAPATTDAGLVVTARNSLMMTYVLYHVIALLGRGYGAFLAGIERGDRQLLARMDRFGRTLGDLDIAFRQGPGPWRRAGGIAYLGPIARSTLVVPFRLDRPNEPVQVRLEMARANWRIDSVGLAPIVARALPGVRSAPELVAARGLDPARVEAWLRGDAAALVTLPGQEVVLRFAVPGSESGAVGYFLESRGYYHEWMRDSWLRDEDIPTAWRYLDDPAAALRELAPRYKAVEAEMAAVFEASRLGAGGRP